jgi:citrate lyase subunit beta/citryl-CoA lyase
VTPPPGPAWLFCPGDRPDRYRKAVAAADVVIIDLEDAVGADRKVSARDALRDQPLDPERVIVRVNPAGTADHDLDIDVLRTTAYRTVMLAKAEHPDQLQGLADWDVVALVETPRGVANAVALADAIGVTGLMWGAEDLIAAMGGRSSRFPDGRYRDVARYARSAVVTAAHAAGCFAVDSVFIDIQDLAGLAAEAQDGAASGFAYKACIHPRQTPVVRQAFRPTADMIGWARRVIEAYRQPGVQQVNGQMIDAPLMRQAQEIVRSADAFAPVGWGDTGIAQ